MASRAGKKQLKVWLDLADHQAVQTHAEAAGLTISDYIRTRCAKAPAKRTRRRPEVKELHRLTGHLGMIGSNVNQLARIANQTGRFPEEDQLKHIRTLLHDMADQIDRALGYDPER